MKSRELVVFVFIMVQMFLFSCISAYDEPPVELEEEYVNQQIKLLAPDHFNTYETISPIALEVQYYSNNDIVFPNNYNVRIFKRTDQGWIELKERPVTRLPEDDILFSADKETFAIRLFTVDPELDKYDEPSELRFYIFGDMQDEQGIKQVAAYVDVKLNP